MNKALAFVVGINDYNDSKLPNLENAVNDASDISDKLFKLGFKTIKVLKANKLEVDKHLEILEAEKNNYDVLLFFFAGHAIQSSGENFLLVNDTNMVSVSFQKNTSISLNFILDIMDGSKAKTKIIILDACRNNPISNGYRGKSNNLAPIFAPQGTIIAFSTSPGQFSQDKGMGRNSIYTGSLLKHIDNPDITIETLFKKVRHSVVNLTDNEQTPWEHTSLVGNFYFCSSDITHASDMPYGMNVVADQDFISDGTEIQEMIEDLRSSTFDWQNRAINKISKFQYDPKEWDLLFLLGRKILFAAVYGSYKADERMKSLQNWILRFNDSGQNHVLNGILFEIYFDSKGLLRSNGFRGEYLEEIYSLQNLSEYQEGFTFINHQIRDFKKHIFYFPGQGKVNVDVKLKREEVTYYEDWTEIIFKLESVKIENVEVLEVDRSQRSMNEKQYTKFLKWLSIGLAIPLNKLHVITQFNDDELKLIQVPSRPKFGIS